MTIPNGSHAEAKKKFKPTLPGKLAVKVGGRWSEEEEEEAAAFIKNLARARTRNAPAILPSSIKPVCPGLGGPPGHGRLPLRL